MSSPISISLQLCLANRFVRMEQPPIEPQKLVFVASFLSMAALSNWMALAYVHDLVGRTPLPDIVFSLIDEKAWAYPVGDLMVTCSALSIILLFIFHKHRAVVVRRTLFCTACLYTLRTVMMLLTQLPSGYARNEDKCLPALAEEERSFYVYFRRTMEQTMHVGFQDDSYKMLCGDLLFSGHTLVMMVATLAADKYLPNEYRILRILPRLFAIIGIPCMVISRTHYTCDVVIAYLATCTVFTVYHSYCEMESPSERRRSSLRAFYFAGAFWRIVDWLEEKSTNNCKWKNEFEIPFNGELDHWFKKSEWTAPRRTQERSMVSNSSTSVAIEPV